MRSRVWTKEDIDKLYDYSKTISQKEAARKLNRTHRSVRSKSKSLGIEWANGFFSFRDIASLAGCNEKQARQFVTKYMKGKVPGVGTGSGFRARIPMEDAEWIVPALKEKYASEPPRKWEKSDKAKLYAYAGKMGISEAAKKLGKSVEVVLKMSSTMGIKWRQGTLSLRDISRETGVSVYMAKKTLEKVYPGKRFYYNSGLGKRYVIDYEKAQRLIQLIKREQGHPD